MVRHGARHRVFWVLFDHFMAGRRIGSLELPMRYLSVHSIRDGLEYRYSSYCRVISSPVVFRMMTNGLCPFAGLPIPAGTRIIPPGIMCRMSRRCWRSYGFLGCAPGGGPWSSWHGQLFGLSLLRARTARVPAVSHDAGRMGLLAAMTVAIMVGWGGLPDGGVALYPLQPCVDGPGHLAGAIFLVPPPGLFHRRIERRLRGPAHRRHLRYVHHLARGAVWL